jgi:hypothetical protein
MEEQGDHKSALKSFRAHTTHNPEDIAGWKNYQMALESVSGADAEEQRGLCERKIRCAVRLVCCSISV